MRAPTHKCNRIGVIICFDKSSSSYSCSAYTLMDSRSPAFRLSSRSCSFYIQIQCSGLSCKKPASERTNGSRFSYAHTRQGRGLQKKVTIHVVGRLGDSRNLLTESNAPTLFEADGFRARTSFRVKCRVLFEIASKFHRSFPCSRAQNADAWSLVSCRFCARERENHESLSDLDERRV